MKPSASPQVFVSRILPEEGLQRLNTIADIDLWEEALPPSRNVLLERVQGVDGIVCLLTETIDGELMDAAGDQLKVISQFAVGYDNIDVEAATARGIAVGNTPGVLTETTADMAFALLMTAARRIPEGLRYVQAGKWQTWEPNLLLGQDIHGATLSIIGFGRIGQAVARRASGFGMSVLYAGSSRKPDAEAELNAQYVDLDTLLTQADFVSLHTPLTSATQHLIDARALDLMKPTAILVNTARGAVVDSQALYEALSSGVISAAALDVTDPEPIPNDDPLLTLPNCIIVPHLGSGSLATRNLMAKMVAQNLEAGLNGTRLPNCVNPEVYNNPSQQGRTSV